MNPTEPTKKKETVRISKKDLLALLAENEHLQQQVKDLQGRCNEYMEEVRSLKKDLEEAEKAVPKQEEESMAERIKKAMEDVKPPPESFNPRPHHFDRNIYIDGASKFRR